jgi:hypothetical protein
MRNLNNVTTISVISIALALLLLSGCGVREPGLTKYTGFTELPFPSNSYAVGQIVEIYSSPRKVEITYQPDIPWDQQTVSPGWDISSTDTEKIKSNLAVEISKVLQGSYEYASEKTVRIQLSNTKTRVIPKSLIYGTLKEDIEKNVGLKGQLNDYIENGTKFDVVTMTLSANISFSLVDSSDQEVAIDSEVIKKLNSEFDVGFKQQSGTNKVITGNDLVVGIHHDPQMVAIILKKA